MNVLVLPDIHLKSWILDLVEQIPKTEYDYIVALGDWVDEWGQQKNSILYEHMFGRLKDFIQEHDNATFCWGNHDLSYVFTWEESGFSYMQLPYNKQHFKNLMNDFPGRFTVLHVIDDVCFSHAGLSQHWVDAFMPKAKSIQDIAEKCNRLLKRTDQAQHLWCDVSPIWYRPLECQTPKFYDEENLFNVTGHTPTQDFYLGEHFLSCDVFSLCTDFTPYGSQDLLIIDTKTHAFKSVKHDIIGVDAYWKLLQDFQVKHSVLLYR